MKEADNRQATVNEGVLIAIGIICAIISLFAYPFIFGTIGVIMGILSAKDGGRAGMFVITTSLILMAAGLLF